MNFINDPIKTKKIFAWLLVGVITFFVAAVVLGVLEYLNVKQIRNLENEKTTLTATKNKEIAALKAQLGITSNSETTSKSQIDTLTKQMAAYKAGNTKALAYNDFFAYVNAVIRAHNGFSGWTDGEFNTAKGKAEATGDTSFVSTVDWAWYNTDTEVLTRLLRVWDETSAGIGNALK